MNPARHCCPSCGVCFTGDDGADGGCCYRIGDVIRLTFKVEANNNPTIFSNIYQCSGGPTGTQCCDPNDSENCTDLRRCCYEVTCDDSPDRWVEYECVAIPNCTDREYRYKPNGTCYCHPYYLFELNGNQSESMPDATACNYPLRFRYLCSGCRVIDGACACPKDHRPISAQPCGYLLPSGDYYEAAEPAPGWEWECLPECDGECLPCLVGSDNCNCTNLVPAGFFAGPNCNVCVKACLLDSEDGTFDTQCGTAPQLVCPDCETLQFADLQRCEGAFWCCYHYLCVNVDGDCENDGGTCVLDHVSRIELKPQQNFSCCWTTENTYRCCACQDEPEALPACPGQPPESGDTMRTDCTP